MDMLNTQLTEKARATDKLETELAEARKSLAKASKDRDQANRKLSESREAVMKMEAEKMSRGKWLEGEKKKWEEEQQTQVVELQDQIKELQEELEELKEHGHGDEMAVDFLEASMMKDELTEVKSELEQKIGQLRSKTTELEETARELRAVKETVEEMKVTIQALEQNQTDDFEEVIPGQKSTSSTATTQQAEAQAEVQSQAMTQPVQPPHPHLAQAASPDQMNSALRTLDTLKSQLSIVSWTRDSKASEQTIATLENKVIELTNEKEALQKELLQRVMAPPTALETKITQLTKENEALQQELLRRVMAPPTALETKVIQLTKEKEALQQELLQRIMAPAPIHLESKVLQLTREKEALQQELVQRIMAPPVQTNRQVVGPPATGSAVTPPSAVHHVLEKQLEKPNDEQAHHPPGGMEIDFIQPERPRPRNESASALPVTLSPAAVPPPKSLPVSTSAPTTPSSVAFKTTGRNSGAVHPLDLDNGLHSDWDFQEPVQPSPELSMRKPSPRKSITVAPSSGSSPYARTAASSSGSSPYARTAAPSSGLSPYARTAASSSGSSPNARTAASSSGSSPYARPAASSSESSPHVRTAASSSESASSTRTAAPSIFMPRSTSPKKLGKKASIVQLPNLIIEKQANSSEPGSSKSAARKPAKPRSAKKTAGSSSKLDITKIEIRNISTNPFIPCISNPDIYFSVLMNSPIVHDSQPNTKLSTVATVLPQQLDVLFKAVHAKAKEITPKVAAFRASRDTRLDFCKKWTLDGQAPINISESLSPEENYIVQLLCVFAAHFHEMDIIPKFYKFASQTIIQDAKNDSADTPSVLVRIVMGVCRAKNMIDQASILRYDILREITKRERAMALSEAVASVWPAVFRIPEQDANDAQRLFSDSIQATIGTIQDEMNGEQIILAHGYDTFVTKCNWSTLDEAPYVDELAEQLMAMIQEPEYARTSPEDQFVHRKALELLLVQGYSWAEILEKYVKTHLIKMLADPEKRRIALALLAAVVRSFYDEASQCLPLRPIIDGILAEEANGVAIL
ncbi:unnamed protein product [Mortierella alpina]